MCAEVPLEGGAQGEVSQLIGRESVATALAVPGVGSEHDTANG